MIWKTPEFYLDLTSRDLVSLRQVSGKVSTGRSNLTYANAQTSKKDK
jgi:hypothetical protein